MKIYDISEPSECLTESQALALWSDIESNAAYQFNKSHAFSYTILSYWSQWVKTHHPDAFYAAALTILGEEKYPSIVRAANKQNILVYPPDLNHSTNRFEIHHDEKRDCTVLYTPFDKVKGLSVKATESILQAREKVGEFESKEQFLSLVNKRSVNSRVQSNLDEIGTFVSVEGGLDPLHPDRLKAQKTLMPGLVVENIKSDRVIDISACAWELSALLKEAKECCDETLDRIHPTPYAPKTAKLMVVSDAPNYHDVEKGKIAEGKGYKPVVESMKSAGLKRSDAYHTCLMKAEKKKGEQLSNQMVIDYGQILDREIELLKPPVIVALGSKSIRHLVPDVKGGWEELAGQSHYCEKRDVTIIFGINPAMLHFDASKQKYLDDVFEQTANIV